ncbi:response regulator [Sphingobacterium multivorum]|uniref:hypothetical protein n=1 Tax=Sphingobacterium multivorum TaxID=28454 RepID=UPI0036B5C264
MEKTFIIGNSEELQRIGGHFEKVPSLINDTDIHNWIIELFKGAEFDKIIIEIGQEPKSALQIAYHIRLSIDELKERALIPILFVSTLSLNNIIIQSGIYGHILSTEGVFFSEFNNELIEAQIQNVFGLKGDEYLTKFLKIINIQPDESIGRHSLANIWGAHALDRAANVKALNQEANFKKGLYFKYISAFNILEKLNPSPFNIKGFVNLNKPNKIAAHSKKILLIDDQANDGWAIVLRKIFQTSHPNDFVVIDQIVNDFDSFTDENKQIVNGNQFDLYLVDLRLNGLEEDEGLNVNAFSGMSVIKKIKTLNKGNQVIVFTASNKAWNLKALIDSGVDGYYLKESPEYYFPKTISDQNYQEFKNNVINCFNKGFLKDIFNFWKAAKDECSNSDSGFISESDVSLDSAWEQIKNGYLDYGYLILFQVVEFYSNLLFMNLGTSGNWGILGETVIENLGDGIAEWKLKYNKDKRNGSYFTSCNETQQSDSMPTTLFKISCLAKFKYHKEDSFLKFLGRLNNLRNGIAHRGGRNSVKIQDIKDLLDFLKILRSK